MRSKYDKWFKLQIVQQYLRGDTSLREVACQHRLDYSMVRRWTESYRQHGALGLIKTYRHYSAEFKREVLERMWWDGLSRRQTAALFDIRAIGAIGRWERQYHSGGLNALAPKRKGRRPMAQKPPPPPPVDPPDDERSREELLEELAYLRAENAYLKKLDALIQEKRTATRGKKRKPSKG